LIEHKLQKETPHFVGNASNKLNFGCTPSVFNNNNNNINININNDDDDDDDDDDNSLLVAV